MTVSSYPTAVGSPPDLSDVISTATGPCVSILMPVHPTDLEQDRIVLKNLVTEAHELLCSRGMRGTDADQLLADVRDVISERTGGFNGIEGLAIYANPDGTTVFPLPFSVDPLTIVSDHFQVKPLFSLGSHIAEFFILALSRKHNRVIRCAGTAASEIDVPDMPKDLDTILPGHDRQIQIQNRSMPTERSCFTVTARAKTPTRSAFSDTCDSWTGR